MGATSPLAPLDINSSRCAGSPSMASLGRVETDLYTYEKNSESERHVKRALDCFCGEYLEGDDDEELLNWTLAHVSRNHSAVGLTDEQVQQIVKEGAYDTPGKAQEGRTSS
jgi:hypothetical protein